MVRCANNGVTAFIDSLGRVTHILSDPDGNIFAEGVLSAEIQIPINPPTTFYMKKGEVFASACLIATFAALGVAAIRRRD
jgi:apolipoprotein N-acyltransferase